MEVKIKQEEHMEEIKVDAKEEVKGDADFELLKSTIQAASSEINLVLTKHKLEFVVVHKLVMNPELKQEEIAHDIVLRPMRKPAVAA